MFTAMWNRKPRSRQVGSIDLSRLWIRPQTKRWDWRVIVPEAIGGLIVGGIMLATVWLMALWDPHLGQFIASLSSGR